jgi:hypothetical protein
MHKKLLLLSFVLPIFMGCSQLSQGKTPGETTRTTLVETTGVAQATETRVTRVTEIKSNESLG